MPTESGESDAELRASEARLAGIMRTALDCIIIIDHTGTVVDFNPAAERTFGYTREEAIGREMAELIVPPSLRAQHRQGIDRAVTTGTDRIAGRRIEITAMRKGGEEFPVELTITRIALADAPPMFAGHIRDIGERRRQEQRQATQYAVTRILAEAATVAEAAPRLLQTICEGLGWDLSAMWKLQDDGLHCIDLWSADPASLAAFESVTRDSIFARGVGLPGRIWEEGVFWIPTIGEDSNFPRAELAAQCGLRSAFGFAIRLRDSVLGVVECFSRHVQERDTELLDVFAAIGAQLGQFIERRRAEDEIRAMNVELEQRVRARTIEVAEANLRLLEALEQEQALGELKSNFVSMVSHEFRTPLGIILSSSEILQHYHDKLDPEAREEQLDTIRSSVLRMSNLMEEVLLFSRIEAGKLSCHPVPIDLPLVAQRLCEEVSAAMQNRCPISWHAENDLSGATADATLLQHLFGNLLGNAVKYSAEGSPVEFAVSRNGNDAVFTIRDRGIGIPAEDQAKLFHDFFRARNTTGIPGTGLGLVIVRRCVDMHGGTIRIESAEEEGTRVCVTLPLYEG